MGVITISTFNSVVYYALNYTQVINAVLMLAAIPAATIVLSSLMKIDKTNFFAKINDNGKNYLVGSNGKLTLINSGYNQLPYIFGKPNIEEFLKFKKIIDSSKFSYDEIKNIYFFSSKRWDLKFHDNILLKLPNNLTQETLDNLYEFLENYNGENFNIIDARLENKIVLDE